MKFYVPDRVWPEVRAAAVHLARQGKLGRPGDELPNLMSGPAAVWINGHLLQFQALVAQARTLEMQSPLGGRRNPSPEDLLRCEQMLAAAAPVPPRGRYIPEALRYTPEALGLTPIFTVQAGEGENPRGPRSRASVFREEEGNPSAAVCRRCAGARQVKLGPRMVSCPLCCRNPARHVPRVTRGDWGVSTHTGSEIKGAELHTGRFPQGLSGPFLPGEGTGRTFPSSEAGWKWAEEHGYLQPYYPRMMLGKPYDSPKQITLEEARRARALAKARKRGNEGNPSAAVCRRCAGARQVKLGPRMVSCPLCCRNPVGKQIVIAWTTMTGRRPTGKYRDRYKLEPIMEVFEEPKAAVWILSGDDADLKKAQKHAATITDAVRKAVFVYPTGEEDPLNRARREIMGSKGNPLTPVEARAGLQIAAEQIRAAEVTEKHVGPRQRSFMAGIARGHSASVMHEGPPETRKRAQALYKRAFLTHNRSDEYAMASDPALNPPLGLLAKHPMRTAFEVWRLPSIYGTASFVVDANDPASARAGLQDIREQARAGGWKGLQFVIYARDEAALKALRARGR